MTQYNTSNVKFSDSLLIHYYKLRSGIENGTEINY